MSFGRIASKLLKKQLNFAMTALYLGAGFLFYNDHKLNQKLKSPLFRQILSRLEEEESVKQHVGLPLSYKTGLFHSTTEAIKECKQFN